MVRRAAFAPLKSAIEQYITYQAYETWKKDNKADGKKQGAWRCLYMRYLIDKCVQGKEEDNNEDEEGMHLLAD